MKFRVAIFICRLPPLSDFRYAPATVGALVGLMLAIATLRAGFAVYLAATTFVLFVGTWAASLHERGLSMHDDRRIIIDEVAGMMICMAGWERAPAIVVLLAFGLFRVLDILKPWPLSWIQNQVGGGVGVMADDIGAAVATILILEILRPFF